MESDESVLIGAVGLEAPQLMDPTGGSSSPPWLPPPAHGSASAPCGAPYPPWPPNPPCWPPPKPCPPPCWPPPKPWPRPPPRWTLVGLAVAYRSAGPISSTSSSMVVRLLPSRSVKERCFRRPCAITRVPFSSDSVTFSAASRQIEQRRNRASPSLHSFACRSNMRGVDAMVNDATAIPDCVKRSSGSAVRLPITVMTVSFAMGAPVLLVYGGMQVGHRYRVVRGGGRCYCEAPTKERHGRRAVEARGLSGSLLVEAHQLGAHHGLVEAELTVELLGGLGLRGEGQDDVDALGLLVDLVGELPLAPDVDVVDGAALGRDDLDELLEGPADGPLIDGRFEDDDHFVLTHVLVPTSCGLCGHGLSVAGGFMPSARHIGDARHGPAQPTRRVGPGPGREVTCAGDHSGCAPCVRAGSAQVAARLGMAAISSRVYSCSDRSNTAAVRPCSTTSPSRITSTSRHSSRSTPRSWVMNTRARSCSICNRESRARIWDCTVTSRAETASSHTSARGERASARAIATLWSCPDRKSSGRRAASAGSRPTSVNRVAESSRSSDRERGARARTGSSTDQPTVRAGSNDECGFWNTGWTIRRLCRSLRETGRPPMCTVPSSGSASPRMMRARVVLPDPDSPAIPMLSPGRTLRSMGSRALTGWRR